MSTFHINEEYQVPPWLTNPHVHTFTAAVLAEDQIPEGIAVQVETEDNDTVLAYSHLQETPETCPDLVLIHGMEGSVDSSYMLRMTRIGFEYGFNIHRMNLRGCGESINLCTKTYNAGLWQDLFAVANKVKVGPKMFFSGVSLGANIILCMLGQLGAAVPSNWKAAATICAPLDLTSGAKWLAEQQKFYDWYFLRYLIARYRQVSQRSPDIYKGRLAVRPQRMIEFDEYVTAPVHGYSGALDYYYHSSSGRLLSEIKLPTLMFHAADDPIVSIHQYEDHFNDINDNSYLELLLTQHGGHGGFIHYENKQMDRYWAERKIMEYFKKF